MPVPLSAPGVNRTPDLQVRSLRDVGALPCSTHLSCATTPLHGTHGDVGRVGTGCMWAQSGHSREECVLSTRHALASASSYGLSFTSSLASLFSCGATTKLAPQQLPTPFTTCTMIVGSCANGIGGSGRRRPPPLTLRRDLPSSPDRTFNVLIPS